MLVNKLSLEQERLEMILITVLNLMTFNIPSVFVVKMLRKSRQVLPKLKD